MPVKTFLNCTMPALVNIRVGSLRGTSGDDGTISWPFSAKKSKNFDLISLTPLMFTQSEICPGRTATSPSIFRRNAFRQGGPRCPETVLADHRLAAAHNVGAQVGASLVDNAAPALTDLAGLCFPLIC